MTQIENYQTIRDYIESKLPTNPKIDSPHDKHARVVLQALDDLWSELADYRKETK